MVWLCDGWRSRFNQRREQRPRFTPVKDNVTDEVIDWTEEPLGGPNILPLMSDSQIESDYSDDELRLLDGWSAPPAAMWRLKARGMEL